MKKYEKVKKSKGHINSYPFKFIFNFECLFGVIYIFRLFLMQICSLRERLRDSALRGVGVPTWRLAHSLFILI